MSLSKSEESILDSDLNGTLLSEKIYDVFIIYDLNLKLNAQINIKNNSKVNQVIKIILEHFNHKLKGQTNINNNIDLNTKNYEMFLTSKKGTPKFYYPCNLKSNK